MQQMNLLSVTAFKTLLFSVLFLLSATDGIAKITLHGYLCADDNSDLVMLEMRTENFTDVVAFQYSFHWNKDVLEFVSLGDFNLPFYNENDFGLQDIQDGYLTTAWVDEEVKGITTTEGTHIFSIYFKKLSNSSDYQFSMENSPIIIEVTDINLMPQYEAWFVFHPDPCTFVPPAVTSVSETPLSNIVAKIQPNVLGSNQPFNLTLAGETQSEIQVQIVSMLGRVTNEIFVRKPSGQFNFEFIAPEQNGLYFLRMEDEKGGKKTLRFFVQ